MSTTVRKDLKAAQVRQRAHEAVDLKFAESVVQLPVPADDELSVVFRTLKRTGSQILAGVSGLAKVTFIVTVVRRTTRRPTAKTRAGKRRTKK